MNPVRSEHTNCVYRAPGCGDLPATVSESCDGTRRAVITEWELEPGEAALLQKTGRVYLLLEGTQVPPLSLDVETPFTDMPKHCGSCRYFTGMGDWSLCCTQRPDLCYADTLACDQYAVRERGGSDAKEN